MEKKYLLFAFIVVFFILGCTKEEQDKEVTLSQNYKGNLVSYTRNYAPNTTTIVETYDTSMLDIYVRFTKDSVYFSNSDSAKFEHFSFKRIDNEAFTGTYSVLYARKSYSYKFIGKDTLEAFQGFSAPTGPSAQTKRFVGVMY